MPSAVGHTSLTPTLHEDLLSSLEARTCIAAFEVVGSLMEDSVNLSGASGPTARQPLLLTVVCRKEVNHAKSIWLVGTSRCARSFRREPNQNRHRVL